MSTSPFDLQSALGLDGSPVAIGFLDERPEGVPAWSGGPVAASCAFWRQARQGQTFYTVPGDHYHCVIGAHVHGIPLPEDRAAELGETVAVMAGAGYIDPAEVPSIPTVWQAPAFVAYAPAADAPFAPDVVLVAGTPAQVMLLHEAALRAGVAPMTVPTTGRPGCAVLPLAVQTGEAALSLGCAGNRMSTGLADGELHSAIPGRSWPAVVDALPAILAANDTMSALYRQRLDRVEGATAPETATT